jgi:16S rRNA (cytosine967-C5)-methyltransferase
MNLALKAAVEILTSIETSKTLADRVVRKYFRKHPELDNAQRARIATDVHGVRCHLRSLDDQLKRAAVESTAVNRIAAYRIMIDQQPAEVVAEEFQRTQLARMNTKKWVWPEDETERLGIKYSMPTFVAKLLIKQLGYEESSKLAQAMNHPGPITIRTRTWMQDRKSLKGKLESEGIKARPTQAASHGLHLLGKPDIRGSALWQSGAFEVQDEGSQLVAEAVDPQPGESILDLCAGAGGKTLALADLMNEKGKIYAADIDKQRLVDLEVRIKRTKLDCVELIHLPDQALPQSVDRVLVDAPCSATGTWRRGPDRKWHLEADMLGKYRDLQLELLTTALDRLRVGGRLVYATCSILEIENKAVIEDVMHRHPDLHLQHQYSLYPHRDHTDGFYIAVVCKSA